MEALAAAGRVQDALAAYRRAHAALAEVGLDPSPRLRAAQTLALEAPPVSVPPVPSVPSVPPATVEARPAVAAAARRSLLRRPVTSLVGRSGDLAALVRLVVDQRVVTLLGPGGVGKTRLAYDVAGRVADEFSGGVRIVELASVT
nr:BTAD domain-containing putative transcriptional regulator [Micromonospora sp. DSM 115978]